MKFDHLRAALLLGALFLATAVGAAETSHKIVLIGGPKSEGPGRHDYAIAIRVLDQLLKSSTDLRSLRAKRASRSASMTTCWPGSRPR
jgi:hypothetical protein